MESKFSFSFVVLLFRSYLTWARSFKERRRNGYELTLFSFDSVLKFGWDISRHYRRRGRNSVHLSLFGLFSWYWYLRFPVRVLGIPTYFYKYEAPYHKAHFCLNRESLYWSRGTTEDEDYCSEKSKVTIKHWPWEWQFVEQRYLSPNQKENVLVNPKFMEREPPPPDWVATHHYVYTFAQGHGDNERYETHESPCRIYAQSMMWKRKCFPFIKMRKVIIDVSFEKEMGPKRGSWKGGLMGCSFDMLPHETILDTVRRMEKTYVIR